MFLPTRRTDSPATFPDPGVSYEAFLGLIWAGSVVSSLCILLRLYSRFHGQRRLFWDDFFVTIAGLMVLATAASWQWAAKFMYYVLHVETGKAAIGPSLLPDLQSWLNVQLIAELFFYTALLMVKISFLIFFRRFGLKVTRRRYFWWGTLVFSLIVYIISVGNVQYVCYNSPPEVVQLVCTTSEANDFTMATLRANMALDVFSDFLIMSIPISMLWNVRIPWNKKLALIGLFSLSIITMVIAIVRAVSVNSSRAGNGQDDATFLWLWSVIQPSLAIIIACLSAFPQLFTASAKKQKPVWTPTDTYYRRLRARATGLKKASDRDRQLSELTMSEQHQHEEYAASNDSQHPWLPPSKDLQVPAVAHQGTPVDQNVVTSGKSHMQQSSEYHVTRQ